MDETYRKAACVSVWLGLAPGAEQYRSTTSKPIKSFDVEPFWMDHMSDLINRPYWTRFWVIQEFLLGEDVNIYCSVSHGNWIDFKDFVEYETKTDFFGDADHLRAGNAVANSCAALPFVLGRHPDKHPEVFRPLHELLVEYHRSKAKNPRDRVFALLGLIPHEERALLQRFFPDYSLSEKHVAIIALAHVLCFDFMNGSETLVTVNSDELFCGLGIEQSVLRRTLLKIAKDINYIGCDGIPMFLAQMEQVDFNENIGMDRDWEAEIQQGLAQLGMPWLC
ncbi:hypothetical protein BP6252_14122 [Coleophoma cylindrospora]|uniref:Heterokaryon incompatibility domain-containing protein n=1 Tax=Coleophoma cylindrospora TaxID=1849047 RepID=A0A3D8Q3W6_9HELO|nr:hypothetical protein BP6252_14122 [Coleophoma cylindrospora]